MSQAASLVLVKPRPKIQAPELEVLSQPGGVPGVRYAEKLSEIFYLHWERFWLRVVRVSTLELVRKS